MPQIIEWKNPGPEDIVWKYPDENITWGAQLIVKEMESAVFFRDGFSAIIHVQSVVKVLPESFLLDRLLQILMGSSNDPDVGFNGFDVYIFTFSFEEFLDINRHGHKLPPLARCIDGFASVLAQDAF
jgi:hypothetical protein